MVNNKVLRNIYANYRALLHGFCFYRTKNFSMPKNIKIRGITKAITATNGSSKMFMEIFLYDEYFLRKLKIESIKTIVDIGANTGIFSITARSFFPNSTIYSYEPNPDIYKVLSENGKEFKFESLCAAVGSKSCFGMLIKEGASGCLSKFVPQDEGNEKMIGLEEILDRHKVSVIDLIKIDCEGCEYELLKQKEVWKKIKFLTMEYHENNLASVTDLLREVNFEIIASFTYPFHTGIVLAKNTVYA